MRHLTVLFIIFSLMVPAIAYSADKQIVLNETGESKIMPTSGSLSFSQVIVVLLKQADGKKFTPEQAKGLLTEQVKELTTTLKKNLEFASDFTKEFNANASFSPYYKRVKSQSTIVGYQVRASYSIVVLDLKRAQEVTQAVLKSGVEDVSQLYTQIDETARRTCEKEALKVAVDRGKKRAAIMAELMESELGAIETAVINSDAPPRMYMAKTMMESDANMYEPQASTCNVRVKLVFSVK
ncbi:SIMPL domain-containing protein [Halodesulfovibrio sp.]|jgi:uncharacterized protein YggE|uniref:SIMPL domain-containing protein n=1 Tax=Halodesulfovibrio sp. TaxID=1912772 RepID=UPI0025F7F957|nr:SIMPL domain-containing protein [Halodesulfovibrio sp.]MCT4625797.1 SIMPL domain-containing protein [Halodesulfovibrio sp.]